jgi:CRISPR system Cascade subunit CasD
MKILVMRLDAPLQSWGTRSHWTKRETGREPTKSGIAGLLAAAMGLPRSEIPTIATKFKMGVRIDREGSLLADYKVGGSLNTKWEFKNMNPDYAWYIQDAVFTVFIDAGEQTDKIVTSLRKPVWIIYLGRKNCPLTAPPLVDIIEEDSLHKAILTYGAPEPGRRYVLDDPNGSSTRNDMPTGGKENAPRSVRVGITSTTLERISIMGATI